jgi:hypothetical protein
MTADYLIEQAVMLDYRCAEYALMNLIDGAAMLAFAFC